MKDFKSDNERKLYEVLMTLSSFPLEGFENMGFDAIDNSGKTINVSDGMSAIRLFASRVDNFEDAVRRILNQTSNLQIQLFNYLLSDLANKKDAQEKELKQMEIDIQSKKESSKQMTFSSAEVLALTQKYNIRGKTSKNTLNKHLNNGILKGKQQPNGTWVIKREDLEKYLGRDDF